MADLLIDLLWEKIHNFPGKVITETPNRWLESADKCAKIGVEFESRSAPYGSVELSEHLVSFLGGGIISLNLDGEHSILSTAQWRNGRVSYLRWRGLWVDPCAQRKVFFK